MSVGQVRSFLFTDIEASTRRWEHDPAAMSAALERHDAIVRNAVEGNAGSVLKHTGDGVVAVFGQPADALRAAVAIQRGLGDDDVRVRAGLHTGRAEERGGDYFGPTLNRAARIMDLGRGGHVLLSGAAAAAIAGDLPVGVRLLDLGDQSLKGFEQAERLHQAIGEGLRDDRALDAMGPGTSRGGRTSFVGREAELTTIDRLLDEERCVTITGVGGCGKTRLAIEAAERKIGEFTDGVVIVELAALADPAEVPRAVADAIAMPVVAASVARDLTIFLRDRECLVVLDNCEHVLDACADLVDDVIDACPGVTVLATSREPLGLDRERSWRVPSLSLPSGDDSDPLACEAVALFTARAEAAQPGFIPTEHRDAVIAICRGLDGLPLAIELAAARTSHLSPEQIATMLDERFRLLTGGARRARQRQQTLQAAMDWSHDLLSTDDRRLLRRLSVFAGGFTLDAATATCGDGDAVAVIDGLGSLVAKSLVLAEDHTSGMRYRMLETVRLYAQDRLVEADEATALRDRHRDWLIQHIRTTTAENPDRALSTVGRVLEPELENLRAAIDWSQEQGQGDLVVRLISLTWPLWYRTLRSLEASAWLDRHVDTIDETLPTGERVEWRIARGFLLQESMNGPAIARCGDEVLTLDPDGAASSVTGLGWFLRLMMPVFVDPAGAVRTAKEALAWVDAHSRGDVVDFVVLYSANAFLSDGRGDDARDLFTSLAARGELDHDLWAWSRIGLITGSLIRGDAEDARAGAKALVASLTAFPGRHVDTVSRSLLAIADVGNGNADRGRHSLGAAAADVRRRYTHIPGAWGVPITATGVILAIEGRDVEAMRLLVAVGAHGRLWQARQESIFFLHREFSGRVAERLGPEATAQAWADGEAMTVDEMHAAVDALVAEG